MEQYSDVLALKDQLLALNEVDYPEVNHIIKSESGSHTL